MRTPEKILVYVYEDLLGDGILKLPFVHALRGCFPKAQITWCAGGGKSIFTSMPLMASPLDQVLEVPLGRTWAELLSASPLKHRFFDLIIDTQRDLKTTLALKKIPHKKFLSRAVFFLFSNFKPKIKKKIPSHLSQQLIWLLEIWKGGKEGVPIPRMDKSFLEPFKAEVCSYFLKKEPSIGFAPGAGNRKKCWPLDRFVEVAQNVKKDGKVPIFILGPAETEWYEEIKSKVPTALFPLQDRSDFLSNPLYTAAIGFFLEAAVVNDAGVAHLLSLSDTALISLFGPTKAEKVHPLCEKLTLVKGAGESMETISVQEVIKALRNK